MRATQQLTTSQNTTLLAMEIEMAALLARRAYEQARHTARIGAVIKKFREAARKAS